MAGLLPLTGGSLWLDQQRIDQLPPERRGFGMVFQNYALFPHLTVRRNVAFGLVMRGVPTALADRISEIVLGVTPEHRIERIVVQEVDGASTEYRFANQKEDVVIGDGRFQFKAPAGTEVVEGGLEE